MCGGGSEGEWLPRAEEQENVASGPRDAYGPKDIERNSHSHGLARRIIFMQFIQFNLIP